MEFRDSRRGTHLSLSLALFVVGDYGDKITSHRKLVRSSVSYRRRSVTSKVRVLARTILISTFPRRAQARLQNQFGVIMTSRDVSPGARACERDKISQDDHRTRSSYLIGHYGETLSAPYESQPLWLLYFRDVASFLFRSRTKTNENQEPLPIRNNFDEASRVLSYF